MLFGGEIIGRISMSKRDHYLTKEERDAFYSLRDDSIIIIKGANKGLDVVVPNNEDYLKEAYIQLEDKEVYKRSQMTQMS